MMSDTLASPADHRPRDVPATMTPILFSNGLRFCIKFLLESRRVKGPFDGFSHMKLQKLLYFVQGYHVGALAQPLFPEAIEAWQHGPVIREVWYQFKEFGALDIPGETADEFHAQGSEVIQTPYQHTLITWVYDTLGRYTAAQLRDMTHRGDPWKQTYVEGEGNVIPLTLMQRYFRRLV